MTTAPLASDAPGAGQPVAQRVHFPPIRINHTDREPRVAIAEIELARSLNCLERDWLIRHLMRMPGVVDTLHSHLDPRRILIEYDPAVTRASTLLARCEQGWQDGPRYSRRS